METPEIYRKVFLYSSCILLHVRENRKETTARVLRQIESTWSFVPQTDFFSAHFARRRRN
jgi:hypothetical protein